MERCGANNSRHHERRRGNRSNNHEDQAPSVMCISMKKQWKQPRCTLCFVDSFDVGDIVKQESVPIDPNTSAVQLTDRLAEIGASLLVRCLSDLHYHLDRCVPQPEQGATLGIYPGEPPHCSSTSPINCFYFSQSAPKIDIQLSHIDWASMSAAQIYNRWRAVRHLFKLQTTFHGINVKLNDVEPPTTKLANVDVVGQPGRIVVDRQRNLLFVRCQENWVAIRHVTLHRRPVMSALDFFNGYLQKKTVAQHYFQVS